MDKLASPPLSHPRKLQLAVVQLLHVAIILYILSTPFVARGAGPLCIYMLVVFAIVMHWVANHHFCVLSLLESKIRGIPYEQGFINSVLKPIFGVGVNRVSFYVIMGLLFAVALGRAAVFLSPRARRRLRRRRRRRRRPADTQPKLHVPGALSLSHTQ